MKKLIGSDIGSYVFNTINGTITFSNVPELDITNILVITNVTSNVMIYSFADNSIGGSLVDNVLTLNYDVSLMNNSDDLQIWVDLPNEKYNSSEQQSLDRTLTTDVNLMDVFGSNRIVENDNLKVKSVWGNRKRAVGNLFGTNNEMRIETEGYASLAVQTSGSWLGVLFVEGFVDGEYYTLMCSDSAGSTFPRNNIQGNGLFFAVCAGCKFVRIRFGTVYSASSVVKVIVTANVAPVVNAQQSVIDAGLQGAFSNAALYSPASTDIPQWPVDPSQNPSQPTSYVQPRNQYLKQKFRRLRVEIAGSESRPLTQDQNNDRLVITYPELYAKLEELIFQQILTNKLLAQAFDLTLPVGMPDIN